ncbi:hypothetical protein ACO0K2_14625 [Undibacterium sp. MH2W]|uniref:hypothetical protein n=1 Tax=Undibacterium sp. MH2W TaxID=3413044 RepID=UPI003BF1D538
MLIGETHFGGEFENSSFLEKVVKPVLAQKNAKIFAEGVWTEKVNPASNEKCLDHSTQRLDPIIADFRKAAKAANFTVPYAIEHYDSLPEMLLYQSALSTEYSIVYPPGISTKRAENRKKNLASFNFADYNSELAKTNQRSRIIGLDSPSQLWDNFCLEPKATREIIVADRLQSLVKLLRLVVEDPDLTSGLIKRTTRSVYYYTLACIDAAQPCTVEELSHLMEEPSAARTPLTIGAEYLSVVFPFLCTTRNITWASIISSNLKKHKKGVITVGSAHLADYRLNDTLYPGLISLLRKDGYRVTPIYTVNDIPAAFFEMSWSDKIRGFFY